MSARNSEPASASVRGGLSCYRSSLRQGFGKSCSIHWGSINQGFGSSFSFTRGGKPHCWDQGLGCRGQVLHCRGSGLGCWNHGHCGRGPSPTTLVAEIAAVIRTGVGSSAVLRVIAGADRSCNALGSRPECSLHCNRLEWANAHIGWDGIWHVEEVFSSQMNPGFRRSGQMADSVWRFADVNVVDQVAHGGSGAMLWAGVRYGQ